MMMSELPDHDALSIIAKENPERLEEMRRHFIEEHINSAPEYMQRRLRGLQFQIDGLRRIHKTPISRCVAISKVMHDSLDRLRCTLSGLHTLHHGQKDELASGEACTAEAQILSFPTLS